MRCEICGSPIMGNSNTETTVCSRCRGSNPRTSQIMAAKGPKTRPSNMPKRPNSSDTIATGFTRSDPPTRKSTMKEMPAQPSSSRATKQPHYNVNGTSAPKMTVATRTRLPLHREPDSEAPQPSSVVLEGKYRLIDELGRGSMGTVFLAEDILLKRKVAVKFLLPELADSSECSVRFKREAIAMASIRNENVAQVYSYGEDKGTPYFVMEYLEGQTVEHLIDSYNRRGFFIPVADAIDIMIQVLVGVSAIHKADAVHRDIKPGNIMIASDPMRAVIMDFGLVRDVKVEDDMRTLAGTPAYIAPELVEGKEGASKSKVADIYSLGATFYELLTGAIPFNGNSWVEILQKHIAEIPVFPSSRRKDLPEVFDQLLMCAMSKEPHERYANCEDFLEDVLEVSETNGWQQYRTTPPTVPPAPARRTSSSGIRRSPKGRTGSDSGLAFRSTPSLVHGRLLVADVDKDFRSMVYSAAKESVPGCRVHSATDGMMAMDMLKTIRPHVLVINLALPEMNGFEIVASTIGEPEFAGMTVIVVSENSGAKDAQLLRSMGIQHFWTKPVDAEALLEVIRPLLEKSV